MTFIDLALSRITPKLRGGENYKKILEFMVTMFEEKKADIDILENMKDIDSDFAFVLDEIGKILGVYPRPRFATSVTGNTTVFTYDVTPYGTVPYASLEDFGVRPLSDEEYSRLLRATARYTNFQGTLDDYESIVYDITNSKSYITNKASSFDVIVMRELSDLEKALLEFSIKKNNLTVAVDFLGTTTGVQPWTYGVTPYGSGAYLQEW